MQGFEVGDAAYDLACLNGCGWVFPGNCTGTAFLDKSGSYRVGQGVFLSLLVILTDYAVCFVSNNLRPIGLNLSIVNFWALSSGDNGN